MSVIPIISSAADLPGAIKHAQRNGNSRWYVAKRAEALGVGDRVPADWGITAAFGGDWSGPARKKAESEGQAMDGGSFPIADEADLKRAIQAYGRAGNKDAAKEHIIKRARALGLTDQIPDDWKATTASGNSGLTSGQDDGGMGSMEPITAAGWDGDLHPRDRKGRFIEKLDMIDVFSVVGGTEVQFRGQAVGNGVDSSGQDYIEVEHDSGLGKQITNVPVNRIESSPPAKARLDGDKKAFDDVKAAEAEAGAEPVDSATDAYLSADTKEQGKLDAAKATSVDGVSTTTKSPEEIAVGDLMIEKRLFGPQKGEDRHLEVTEVNPPQSDGTVNVLAHDKDTGQDVELSLQPGRQIQVRPGGGGDVGPDTDTPDAGAPDAGAPGSADAEAYRADQLAAARADDEYETAVEMPGQTDENAYMTELPPVSALADRMKQAYGDHGLPSDSGTAGYQFQVMEDLDIPTDGDDNEAMSILIDRIDKASSLAYGDVGVDAPDPNADVYTGQGASLYIDTSDPVSVATDGLLQDKAGDGSDVEFSQNGLDALRPYADFLDVDSGPGSWASGLSSYQFDNLGDYVQDWMDDPQSVPDWADQALQGAQSFADEYGNGDPYDAVQLRKSMMDLGWAQEEQLRAVLRGDPLGEQNSNALENIGDALVQNGQWSVDPNDPNSATLRDVGEALRKYANGAFEHPPEASPTPEDLSNLGDDELAGLALDPRYKPDAPGAELTDVRDAIRNGDYAAASTRLDEIANDFSNNGDDFGPLRALRDEVDKRAASGPPAGTPGAPDTQTDAATAQDPGQLGDMIKSWIEDKAQARRDEGDKDPWSGLEDAHTYAEDLKTPDDMRQLADELDNIFGDEQSYEFSSRLREFADSGDYAPADDMQALDAPVGSSGYPAVTEQKIRDRYAAMEDQELVNEYQFQRNEERDFLKSSITGAQLSKIEFRTDTLRDELDKRGLDNKAARKGQIGKKTETQPAASKTSPVTPGTPSPAVAPSTSDPAAASKLQLMSRSAEKSSTDLQPADVTTRLDGILGNEDHDAAHKDLAKLMTELKLGGKQRKRYRELLDSHQGRSGDDSAKVEAATTADGLSAGNPVKERLAAKATAAAPPAKDLGDVGINPAGEPIIPAPKKAAKKGVAPVEAGKVAPAPGDDAAKQALRDKVKGATPAAPVTSAPPDANPASMSPADLEAAISAESERLYKETGKFGQDSPLMRQLLSQRDANRRAALLRGEGHPSSIPTPAGPVRAGDVITYDDRAEGPRRMLVEGTSDDVKNGKPGFDGVLVDNNNIPIVDQWGREESKWGYADQALSMLQKAPEPTPKA